MKAATPGNPSCNDSVEALSHAGIAALNALVGSVSQLTRLAFERNPFIVALRELPHRRSCEIPPPCWMPECLGEVHSLVCPGGSAVLRIRVTNRRAQATRVRLEFGSPETSVSVSPQERILGPMERGEFTAKVTLADDACKGQKQEHLLWIRGCNVHYLRWVVESGERDVSSCHELALDDGPDPVHHWYDHFYCDRPCRDGGATTGPNAGANTGARPG